MSEDAANRRNRNLEALAAQQHSDLALAPHRIVVAQVFDGTRQLARPTPAAHSVRPAAQGLGLLLPANGMDGSPFHPQAERLQLEGEFS